MHGNRKFDVDIIGSSCTSYAMNRTGSRIVHHLASVSRSQLTSQLKHRNGNGLIFELRVILAPSNKICQVLEFLVII